jgi:hypothetical protein
LFGVDRGHDFIFIEFVKRRKKREERIVQKIGVLTPIFGSITSEAIKSAGFFTQKGWLSLLQCRPLFQALKPEWQELAVARIVFLVLSLFAASTWAQQAIDVYRVEASVADQSDGERVAAAKANLGEVITRVLGDTAALQNPLVIQAINEAPNYLAKFSYSSEKTIVLNYSPQAIQTLFQQAHLIAANATTTQGVMLYVIDIKDFTSFKQVQAYLRTVGVIRSMTLVGVDKETLQFNLLLDGDESLLKTTLSAGNKLQVVVGDTLHPLSFRWQN